MSYRVAVLAVIAGISLASPTFADEITGSWCPPGGGRSLVVDNLDKVTFAGQSVTANVQRHHIDFIVPKGQKDAGLRFKRGAIG